MPGARLGEEVGGDEGVGPGGGRVGGGGVGLEEVVGAAEGEGLVGDEHAEHLHADAVGGRARRRRGVRHPGRLDPSPFLRLPPPPVEDEEDAVVLIRRRGGGRRGFARRRRWVVVGGRGHCGGGICAPSRWPGAARRREA